jgi:hypothetical protein
MTLRKKKELHLHLLSHLILRKIGLLSPLPAAFAELSEGSPLSLLPSVSILNSFHPLEEGPKDQVMSQPPSL